MLKLLYWNKRLGDDCEFLVFNSKTNEYCQYNPLAGDEVWKSTVDYSNYRNWEDMKSEPIESLEDLGEIL